MPTRLQHFFIFFAHHSKKSIFIFNCVILGVYQLPTTQTPGLLRFVEDWFLPKLCKLSYVVGLDTMLNEMIEKSSFYCLKMFEKRFQNYDD